LLVSAIFDLIDGSVARKTNSHTDFGAVFDWIVDKYVDALVLLGIGLAGIPIISQYVALPPGADFGVVAFAITYWLFTVQVKRSGQVIGKDTISNFFFAGLGGMLVGARIFATLIYSDDRLDYLTHPWLIFWPFDKVGHFTGFAGMSFHGGLLGVIVGFVLYARAKKLDILQWSDWVVAAFPLGYTFGRLGNFINGELWGRVTTAPWGMVFPRAESFPASEPWVRDFAASVGLPVPGATALVNLPRHPSQLYEAFFEGIVLWLVLWFIVRKRKPYKGFVICWYMIGYGIIRFFIEYTRQPDKGLGFGGFGYPIILQPLGNYYSQVSLFNFTTGQILNVLLIVAAVIMMAIFRARARRLEAAPTAPHPTGRKLRKKLK